MKLGRFLMWQAWFLLLIIGGYLVYRRTRSPEKNAYSALPLRRSTSVLSRLKQYELPDTLSFCDESFAVQTPWRTALEKILWSKALDGTSMLSFAKHTHPQLKHLQQVLTQQNLSPDLAYVLFQHDNDEVFPWTDSLARACGLRVDAEVNEHYHLERRTKALMNAVKKGSDVSCAEKLLSLYMGSEGLRKKMSEQEANTVFELVLEEDARDMLLGWVAKKVLLSGAGRFGYSPKRPAPVVDTLHVIVSMSIPNLSEWVRRRGYSYQTLRAYNPWLAGQSLHLLDRERYVLSLPRR